MHLLDLPYGKKLDLCKILEANNCFEQLAEHMQFEEAYLQTLRCHSERNCSSPIQQLLKEWGTTYNHTVSELFILLYRMKQCKAMEILKPFTDNKYHFLIRKLREEILNGYPEPITEATREPKMPRPDVLLVMKSAGTIPQIPYEELLNSTNNWDDADILGQGGFGKVFKGTWQCTQVAIKRIEKKDTPESSYQQIVQSNTELYCLTSYIHENVLPLYAYI